MSGKSDWNPELYLKFRNERTQPAVDLVARIALADPAAVVDIGCGPGNSTQVLLQRWPTSRVTGVDQSPAMIEKAKADYPGQRWVVGDARNLDASVTYDLVFSNATIQWIPDHRALLAAWWNLVNAHGALAVQMPLYQQMPICAAIEQAANSRWAHQTADVLGIFTFHAPDFYYDVLAELTPQTDLWVTDYVHVMADHAAIVEMIRSTGMRPYLERLGDASERAAFEAAVLANLQQAYSAQPNGRVLFPFKRLFFVAYR